MRSGWWVVFVVAGAIGCASVSKDLRQFCATAGAVDGDASIPDGKKLGALLWRARRAAHTGEMRELIHALPAATPAMRYRMIRDFARQEGVKAWSCPALTHGWVRAHFRWPGLLETLSQGRKAAPRGR